MGEYLKLVEETLSEKYDPEADIKHHLKKSGFRSKADEWHHPKHGKVKVHSDGFILHRPDGKKINGFDVYDLDKHIG